MRVLVIYGNDEILERAKPIFKSQGYDVDFIEDSTIKKWFYDCEDVVDIHECYAIVFSLHCKKVFPKRLVNSVRCINIHPGFNPHNRGMFPHVWSIINGLPTGATIHEMDDQIDHGKILARATVPIDIYDTSETLYQKVINCEMLLLEYYLPKILSGELKAFEPESEGNYNSLADFKKLCQIDIAEHGKTYNLFRALSHGNYKNARIGNRHFKLEIL